jgi:hypothetical protein
MKPIKSIVSNWRRSEDGHAVIEFAITLPAILFVFMSGIELAFVSLQHSMLERAVDITGREIRLGTGTAPQHNEIKDLICERAGFIDDCRNNLRLEMIQVDPRNWLAIAEDADCTDTSQDVKPVRSFKNGLENELMVLRACAKMDPVFPTTGLGKSLEKDGSGKFSLVAATAFVQEPE